MKNGDKRLVFLISQPRSGSTLLQAILGTHSQIHTTSEPWIALAPLSLWRKGSCEFDYDMELSRHTQSAFFDETGVSKEFIRNANRNYLLTFYEQAMEASGKPIFLDKTPRYYEILPELHATFPEAHFILLHRNPIDVLKSVLLTWVGDDAEKLFLYKRDLFVAIDKINEFSANNHTNVTSLTYEDLTRKPGATIEQVCNSIGLTYEPSMLNYRSRSDWKYGDQSIKDYTTVTESRKTNVPISALSQQNQQFIKFYIRNLSTEQCVSYGYPHNELLSQLEDIKVRSTTYEIWDLIMSTPSIVDFSSSTSVIRSKIISLDRMAWARRTLKNLGGRLLNHIRP